MTQEIILAVFVIFFSFGITSAEAYHNEKTSRGSNDPNIAVNGNDAYVVWLESNHPSFGDVYFTKVIDGKTIQESINITNGTSFYPRPQIHVYGNNVYLLWEDRNSEDGDDQIFFAKSNDDGKTFSKPKSIPQNNQSIFRPASVQQVNDIVYVFGSNWDRATKQNSIIVMTSNDFGDTFSEPTVVFNHEQSDQEITVKMYEDTIYILSDDRNDFDEKGSLYLRKILPNGKLTEIVNVNGGKTSVTHPQFAVFEENVYVSWRERVFEKGDGGITERWYQVFTKSHDGGNTFDEIITFDSDPKSIDTVGIEGDFVFAHNDSVYVLWKSEYWDGKTQEFKIYLAYSTNKGKDFITMQVPLNEKLANQGYITTMLEEDTLYQIAIIKKNPPYDDAAVYFTSKNDNVYSVPIDILKDIQTRVGWMPKFAADKNNIHFVTEGNNNKNCLLYSFSSNKGQSFGEVINLSPNGSDHNCFGKKLDNKAPIKQVSLGIELSDVQCKEDRTVGYILSLRERDSQPVCVSADSYEELVNRGWLLEDGQELLSLHAAKKFIQSSPIFLSAGDEESINLDIVNVRKTIPPIVTINGTFVVSNVEGIPSDGPFQSVIETHETKNITIQIAQINKIHSAIIDGEWDEINQDYVENISKENTFHEYSPGPTSRIVLEIGDVINKRGMIPITITEISENVRGSATFWQFQPLRHDGDNRGKTWDFLPESHRQGWGFFDENGNDAWDDSKIPRDRYGIPADGHRYPMFCGDQRVNGESAHPSGIPIKPDVKTVIIKSGQMGYLPDSEGVYNIRYGSLFETDVEFPDNAKIIENESMLCIMENIREDATHAYYTNLVFKFEE
ncbi:sialidase family protein [Nitrosopumilus piranensis]|uniref:sialidase family protein n=1 Tax=Nitrosopumilus piranensis TaxID=1582439 RepID=UPI0011E5D5D0|nr:sialidase family protein [Nitrosopumilus piranensis]